jgi:hypothetical protein
LHRTAIRFLHHHFAGFDGCAFAVFAVGADGEAAEHSFRANYLSHGRLLLGFGIFNADLSNSIVAVAMQCPAFDFKDEWEEERYRCDYEYHRIGEFGNWHIYLDMGLDVDLIRLE